MFSYFTTGYSACIGFCVTILLRGTPNICLDTSIMTISEKLTDLEALENEQIYPKKCPYNVLSLRMRKIFFLELFPFKCRDPLDFEIWKVLLKSIDNFLCYDHLTS